MDTPMIKSILCPKCGGELHFSKPVPLNASAGVCEYCLTILLYTGPLWAQELTAINCPLPLLNTFSMLQAKAKEAARQRRGGRIIT